MTECREQRWLFQGLGNGKVEVDFGGGYLSSDGGGLILRELERHDGLLKDFSSCFIDYRDQRYIEHSVQELVSQRIHGRSWATKISMIMTIYGLIRSMV